MLISREEITVNIASGSGNYAGSTDLAGSQILANCVPIFTFEYDSSNDIEAPQAMFPTLIPAAGQDPAAVSLTRSYYGGAVAATLTVYEFDPAKVQVLSGAWSMAAGVLTAAVSLGTAVDLGAAYPVVYGAVAGNADSRSVWISSSFTSTSELTIARHSSAVAASGRWWVLVSLDSGFAVQPLSRTGAGTITIPNTVDPDATFLVGYATTDTSFGKYGSYQSRVRLTNGDTVTVSNGVTFNVYAVTFSAASGGSVRRGTNVIGSGTAAEPVALSPAVDLGFAMASRPDLHRGTYSAGNGSPDRFRLALNLTESALTADVYLSNTVLVTFDWELILWSGGGSGPPPILLSMI